MPRGPLALGRFVTFFVAGRPRSTQTGSVIRVQGRAIPLRRGTAWSAVCGLVARQHAPSPLLIGPVRVVLLFVLPRPKRRKEHYVTTRPDVENLCKGLLDSWNGVLWQDDAHVAELSLTKVYEDDRLSPGVLVTAQELRHGGTPIEDAAPSATRTDENL